METDRKLDALVAEKVMGYQGYPDLEPPHMIRRYGRDDRIPLPCFSADIAVAWRVVEKMISIGYKCVSVDYVGIWRCFMTRGGFGKPPVEAATAPLAICLAALEAVGEEVEDVQ